MAKIEIVGNIVSSQEISRYSTNDTNLVSSTEIQKEFNPDEDYIEFYLYDVNGTLLTSNYNYQDYKNPIINGMFSSGSSFTTISIDPVLDVQNYGYNTGDFTIQYNFFKNRISDLSADLFILDISSDRTEIRATSVNISAEELTNLGTELIQEINNSPYYVDFLLNFGNNQQFVVVNIAVENLENGQTNILFKLYQPLPGNVLVKSSFWVVEEIIEPFIFGIDLSTLVLSDPLPILRGPNFDIDVKEQNTISTSYQNYNTLISNISSSNLTSYQQYLNILNDKGVNINVDYTNLNEFIHFGSGEYRLNVFYSKVKAIEDYNNYIQSLPTSSILNNNLITATQNRDSIISQFDGFEAFMYFQSGSYSWPKVNSNVPYILQSTGSSEVINWFNNQINTAIAYDNENLDKLINIIPEYIKEDEINQPYLDFTNMVGHFFDNIFIYVKAVTDLYKNRENLYDGISKDLVIQMLQSLGSNIYNSEADVNNSDYLTGYYLGSPSDYTNLTSSYLDNVPRKDLMGELYKRIYSNIPILIKSKGSSKGLKQIITTFGITGSILNVKEFGGNLPNETLINNSLDKIRISDNNIQDNVLSPFISIETTTQDRYVDIHHLDVSFSPQNQIDTAISSSITGSFNLDNYIGDPGYEYSSSYFELDNLRKTAISSSFTMGYDYGGFIRLAKYFDNSVFKMIEDYVPARVNLSTGVTIRPQAIERVKIKKYPPEFSQLEVLDAVYAKPRISENKEGNLYDIVPGDKSQFYNGELSGSFIDTHTYFNENNENPYLRSSTTLSDTFFSHSQFNVLDNNIIQNRLSTNKTILETNGVSYSLAEYQDYYDVLSAQNISRYYGSKTQSKLYNTYTTGDLSYGQTAAIDKYVRQLGFFTEVSESRFLSNRNNVVLKYLVDEFGNLFELNESNKNWMTVQRTFVEADVATVSLFNSKKYSNQKSTNGVKPIWNSGYSYYPTLYYSGSDSTIQFSLGEQDQNLLFVADNNPRSASVSGNRIWDAWNLMTSNTNGYYHTGSIGSVFPRYNVAKTTTYVFNASLGISATVPSGITGSFTLNVREINSNTLLGTQNINLATIYTGNDVSTIGLYYDPSNYFPSAPFNIAYAVYDSAGNLLIPQGASVVTATVYHNATLDCSQPNGIKFTSPTTITIYNGAFNAGTVYLGTCGFSSVNVNLLKTTPPSSRIVENLVLQNPATTAFALTTNSATLTSGSIVEFQISSSLGAGISNININTGQLRSDFNAFAGNNLTTISSSISSSFNLISPNILEFNSDFSSVQGYTFQPSSSVLYSKYGDVDYTFSPQSGDIIIISTSIRLYEFKIIGTSIVNSKLRLTLLPSFAGTSLGSIGTYQEVLLLTRINDETNMIITFNKRDGQTSSGFIIPDNLHPDVLDSINDITKEVKQKLIDIGENPA